MVRPQLTEQIFFCTFGGGRYPCDAEAIYFGRG